MNFRFSRGNVTGTLAAAMAFVAFKSFGDVPLWASIGLIVTAVALGAIAGVFLANADSEYEQQMKAFVKAHGWDRYWIPRWVWEARAFPLLGEKRIDGSHAWAGEYRGNWAVSTLIDLEPKASESHGLRTFQIIGLPFNDDMPRVQIVPEDSVEKAAKMVGGKDIDFESADFNAAWRVRGEDAKRVHDIVHPRTMHRLLKDDARGVPVIIDAGAIWSWRADPVAGEDLERILGVLHDVATAIPATVYQDFKTELVPKRTDGMHDDWVESRKAVGKPDLD